MQLIISKLINKIFITIFLPFDPYFLFSILKYFFCLGCIIVVHKLSYKERESYFVMINNYKNLQFIGLLTMFKMN